MNEPNELDLPEPAKMRGVGDSGDIQLPERIARLVQERPYGVLCTQSQSQPYGSLVALVIDSRSGASAELMQVEAVTATGRAHVVPPGPDFERWAGLLIGRHPHLAAFVRAESSALVRVEVARYFHVCRFQEVRQWVPSRTT